MQKRTLEDKKEILKQVNAKMADKGMTITEASVALGYKPGYVYAARKDLKATGTVSPVAPRKRRARNTVKLVELPVATATHNPKIALIIGSRSEIASLLKELT